MARGRSWFTILVLCFSAGVSLMMLFVAVAQWTGLDPARDGEAATGGVMLAIMTGTMAVAGVFLTRPRKPPSLAEAIQHRIGTLSALLDEVFAAYEALVAAARALLEDPSAGAELVRATDHLANLTEGLHEISALDQTDPR